MTKIGDALSILKGLDIKKLTEGLQTMNFEVMAQGFDTITKNSALIAQDINNIWIALGHQQDQLNKITAAITKIEEGLNAKL